jgi:hypothetical protein
MFPHYSYQSVGSFMSDFNYRVTGRKKSYDWRNLQFFFNEAQVDLETGLEVVSFEEGIFAGWKFIKFNSESEAREYMFNKLDYPIKELENKRNIELENEGIIELENYRIKEVKKVIRSELATKGNNSLLKNYTNVWER